MANRTVLGAAAVLTLLLPSPLQAQEKGGKNTEIGLKTKLFDSFKKGEWNEAIDAYNQLKEGYEARKNKHFVYLAAQAYYNLGKKHHEEAASALAVLLELQEDHVGGLYLLAKIKAQSGKVQDLEHAKERLLAAARAGRYVLRDLNSAEGQEVFKQLVRDSSFVLRVMSASNEFQVSTTSLRNPFKSPLRVVTRKGGKVSGGKGLGLENAKRLAELEKRVELLFADIAELAEQRNVEELIGKFTDLRQIMAEYGKDGSEAVKKRMKKWNKQLAAMGEIKLSIQLQIYINEGNLHLRAMADAIKKDEFDKALEGFERIKAVKDQMYAEQRDVFHRNADALLLRGKALADRATRLKRISEFKLVVTGVIVAPPNDPQAKNSAIINDRIYREGDTIISETTEEEIEGLFVVAISRSLVRFRFQDTPFVRQLKTAGKLPPATFAAAPPRRARRLVAKRAPQPKKAAPPPKPTKPEPTKPKTRGRGRRGRGRK